MDDYSHIYSESRPLIIRQSSFDNVLQHHKGDTELINSINRLITRGVVVIDNGTENTHKRV